MGHFAGEPALPDAQAARRAILYLRRALPDLSGILLIRDQDDQPKRLAGLEQAGRNHAGSEQIVVGLAVPERESWVLCGFDPANDGEPELLAAERQKLGFDPRTNSHQLTACKDDRALRSPRRVLKLLTCSDPDREWRCWSESSLDQLRERGSENRLAEYLKEIRDNLAGLIGHTA